MTSVSCSLFEAEVSCQNDTCCACVTATLAVLRKAVERGEIDVQIEAVSAGVRRGFNR